MEDFINIACIFSRMVRFVKSCKISEDIFDNTRKLILIENLDVNSVLYLTSLLTNNQDIISFVARKFAHGKVIGFHIQKTINVFTSKI